MKKIRILQFTDTLSKNSGVMSVIMNYYNFLDKDKIQFDFIHFLDANNSNSDDILNNGGKIYKINPPSLSKSFKEEFNLLLKEINKDNTYQTIHIHSPFFTFLIANTAKANNIKNIIVHSHATTYSDHFKGKVRNFLIKNLAFKKYITNYMSCSIKASDFLFGSKAYKNNKTYLLNNAIDLEKFKFNESIRDQYRKKLKVEDYIVLGNVGRLEKQKNQLFLLKMFNQLNKKHPNKYKLIIVGDGSYKERLNNYIKKHDLSSDVLMLGFRSDVKDLLNAFDLFLLPSLFEGLPVVSVEALANGLTNILSNKITKEVGLFNTSFVKISSKNKWVKAILNTKINERFSNYDLITKKHYNIKEETNNLYNYYKVLEGSDFK